MLFRSIKEPPPPPEPPGGDEDEQPQRFAYKINCNNMDQIISTIKKIPIIRLEAKNLTVALDAQLSQDDHTSMTIHSTKAALLENLLASIKTYVLGTGNLTISSDSDLTNTLTTIGIEFTQV